MGSKKMTIDVAQFRTDYPEFASTSKYPDAQINYWLAIAALLLNVPRWGTMIDFSTELFVAHNIALEARAVLESAAGGIPGGLVGPVNSKSVDKVSVGYDIQAGIVVGAGPFNLTNYGTRFMFFARLVGAGPIQVGPNGCDNDPLKSFNAYQGPYWGGYPEPE